MTGLSDHSPNDPESPSMEPPPAERPQQSLDHSPAFQEQEDDGLLFKQFFAPPPPSRERIPNLGHVALLILLISAALLCAILLARVGVYFHLFGVRTTEQAATDIHYTLGIEGILYLVAFGGALLLFPALWGKGFFAGLQWQGREALRHSGYLLGAAVACFALAVLNGLLMPGPADAPIDKVFRIPGAAWVLFGFGVTFAPFFEEIAFRGFLLPAFCTAFDWTVEASTGKLRRPLFPDGHPRWSMSAMAVSSVVTSLLFALMHADQTGYSLGPFLLLICVSLVLCAARLVTRSLAASVLIHATYNFLLFALMFLGTAGFRHVDKM